MKKPLYGIVGTVFIVIGLAALKAGFPHYYVFLIVGSLAFRQMR